MSVVYLVRAEVDRAAEEAWKTWMEREHVPEVLAEPGFTRAVMYRAETPAEGPARWEIAYESVSREALEGYLSGDAVKRLRAASAARFGATARLSREILVPEAVVAARTGGDAHR